MLNHVSIVLLLGCYMNLGCSGTGVTICSCLLEIGVGVWQDYVIFARHCLGSFCTIQARTNCAAKTPLGAENCIKNANLELKTQRG